MILYQQHIMWYESEMLNETLDSLQIALKYSTLPIDLEFCLNSQTYIETPIKGKPEDMFEKFKNHPILKNAKIIYKTDNDPFYNIGDWRREIYSNKHKYTVWGESDCLVPHQANIRIINSAAKRLKLGMDKVFVNVEKYGNTSAASIPIALAEAVENKKIKKGRFF